MIVCSGIGVLGHAWVQRSSSIVNCKWDIILCNLMTMGIRSKG